MKIWSSVWLCALAGAAQADDAALTATIARLDREMFTAFNQCDQPDQLNGPR